MEKIMLAPFGAPPTTNERISAFQIEIIDATETRVGVINADAAALALQNLNFAVHDMKQITEMPFGKALFHVKQGKKIRRSVWPDDTYLIKEGNSYTKYRGDWPTPMQLIDFNELLLNDWEVVV